jgi:hypothetical protein
MKLKPNVGKNDKAIRFILGLIFLFLGYTYSAWLYLIAAGSLITSFTGQCGLYRLFKINTCSIKKK